MFTHDLNITQMPTPSYIQEHEGKRQVSWFKCAKKIFYQRNITTNSIKNCTLMYTKIRYFERMNEDNSKLRTYQSTVVIGSQTLFRPSHSMGIQHRLWPFEKIPTCSICLNPLFLHGVCRDSKQFLERTSSGC